MSEENKVDLKKEKEKESQGSKLDEAKPVEPVQPTVKDLGEIKETTGSAVEIYDEDDNVDLSDTPVKKKKFKKNLQVLEQKIIIFLIMKKNLT